MELNNEMQTRIFAMYWGSEYVVLFDKDKYSDPITIDRKVFAAMIGKPETPRFIILTPLDEISDEDAIEVARIIFAGSGEDVADKVFYIVKREESHIEVEFEKENLSLFIVFECAFVFVDNSVIACSDPTDMTLPVLSQASAIDYLRSKSYDCGYGNISSLIQSKIAIKKSK